MAEDDMLLNFSIDDASLKPKSVFKGGKWRDRVRATKTSGGRQRMVERKEPTANGGSASKEAEVFGDPNQSEQRPSKRQKTAQTDGPSRGNEQRIQVPKEVVSSLFTYNPISKFKLTPNVEEDQQAKPTNAPLLDGLDTFLSLGLSTSLAIFVRDKLKITAPTMIQKSTIPQLLKDDSDVFMQAETGSGKTLAYLLPIVQRIMNQSKVQKATGNEEGSRIHRDSGLFAIVLAPTRELCKQISVVLESLLRCAPWIVCGTVTGGEKKKSEKARLRKGLNVLVATPGRLADHLANTKVLDVSSIRWLVLDEADRLMELGFEVQIKEILSELQRRFNSDAQHAHGSPLRRTTILCSATMKMNVQRLGSMSLRDAVHLKANTLGAEANGNLEISHEQIFAAPAQLKQSCLIVPAKQRLVTLAALLKHNFARKGSVMKAIVFMSCADSVDFHFSVFGRQPQPTDVTERSYEEPALTRKPDLPTRALAPFLTSSTNPELTLYKLHGSLTQFLRTSTLASFTRSPNPSILLCTDVASRGLDLPTLDLVIEYDPAFSAEDRLHRIGRTARAGQDGRAIVFLQPGPEEGYLEILERGCGSSVEETRAQDGRRDAPPWIRAQRPRN